MTDTERRLAEIYSYYIDDCIADDFAGTFTEWLAPSMYAGEVSKLCDGLFTVAWRETRQSSVSKASSANENAGRVPAAESRDTPSGGTSGR